MAKKEKSKKFILAFLRSIQQELDQIEQATTDEYEGETHMEHLVDPRDPVSLRRGHSKGTGGQSKLGKRIWE